MPADWVRSGEYEDILYDTAEGIAKITIARPEVRNAFRPRTLFELIDAFIFFQHDLVAEFNALITDVDRRARDELLDLFLRLPAERALQVPVSVVPPSIHA